MPITAEIIFVKILIPLALGIYCCYQIENPIYIDVNACICFLTFIVLLWINLFYKNLAAYHFKLTIGILFTLFFFFFGGWITLLKKDILKSAYFDHQPYKQLKIWISDEPHISENIIRFTADVQSIYNDKKNKTAIGKILISIKTDPLHDVSYQYGDELIISTKAKALLPPFNPGEFDFRAWLGLKNIYHQAFLNQNMVIKTGFNVGNPILKYALALRKRQIETYRKIINNQEALSVASTLILGYRADLSSETLSSYSKTGTIHALSVSGMHVGIIYIVLNTLLRFLNKKAAHRILKIILICIFIWFYSILTGLSPSILRSAIMLTIYILAKSFHKHTNAYNILAFTACSMLIHNPFLVWDVGFQLSFLAVFGLIYLYPKIYKWLYFKPKWADWLWSSISLSIAAQIITFPLSIYYFHQFPIYFIFSNLFILLPVMLLMYLGLSILLFKLYFLAPVFEWLIIFMNDGLKWIANLPLSTIHQIWISKTQLFLLSLILILGLIALTNYKKHLLLISIALFFILQFSLSLQAISIKQQKKILFFSLQKGYAALFIYAQEAILLSSLKPIDKNFQFYIQPAVDQLHIKKIHLINWEVDTAFLFFKKKNHQINFFGYKTLLLDSFFDRKIITSTPTFNTIWLHQNPKIEIQALRKAIIFNSIIVDASNYAYNIKNYIDEANKFQIQSHVLKKNKAYLIDLNNPP